mmetsp:Transcript_5207/g.10300  ORF Transcript_5207/g.10300 Transcript_5207/m.10300 type:complete len:205 (-) Transcript_5207:44-658(-)
MPIVDATDVGLHYCDSLLSGCNSLRQRVYVRHLATESILLGEGAGCRDTLSCGWDFKNNFLLHINANTLAVRGQHANLLESLGRVMSDTWVNLNRYLSTNPLQDFRGDDSVEMPPLALNAFLRDVTIKHGVSHRRRHRRPNLVLDEVKPFNVHQPKNEVAGYCAGPLTAVDANTHTLTFKEPDPRVAKPIIYPPTHPFIHLSIH